MVADGEEVTVVQSLVMAVSFFGLKRRRVGGFNKQIGLPR